jgi:hypothetical protein
MARTHRGDQTFRFFAQPVDGTSMALLLTSSRPLAQPLDQLVLADQQ